jgi:hypothetical protein
MGGWAATGVAEASPALLQIITIAPRAPKTSFLICLTSVLGDSLNVVRELGGSRL